MIGGENVLGSTFERVKSFSSGRLVAVATISRSRNRRYSLIPYWVLVRYKIVRYGTGTESEKGILV